MKLIALIISTMFAIFAYADTFQYKGCYSKDDLASKLVAKGAYTYQSRGWCQSQCPSAAVLALLNGSDCFCGDDAKVLKGLKTVEEAKCNKPCNGYPFEVCGSENYLSVLLNDKFKNDV
ncbi:uncharacterized protein Ecym_3364 [Eremothecium cymbalariae DBVPG|uniref:WSC domain-containing protein n=1 Tax=Eremothecium cymbalariae (strain CBS 270.75 / DBVPG 7215 / KCTC 17166 / NRRL Y-17582) TaxID=931890 RepID=G8JRT2_ERECY|nr:Hypothetical protein Ecym_3364 [Eremothecium cymbalariae DBVPG\